MGDEHDFDLIDRHSGMLANLQARMSTLEKAFDGMSKQLEAMIALLNKVKNWVVGGITVALAQQFGVFELIKLYIEGLH